MEYLAQQSKTFLKQMALWHEPENLFLTGMVAISIIKKQKEKIAAFENLHEQLNKIPISISGNAVNRFILNWLKQKTG